MFKKLAVGTGVALTAVCSPLALGAGVAAAAAPVTLTGAINCTATGQIRFNVALVNLNPSGQSTVSVKVKLSKCTGPGTISAPVTLKSGSLVASSSPTTMLNACGVLTAPTPLPTLTGTISWKGSKGKITSSTVTIQGATGFFNQGTSEIHVSLPTSIGTGSYAGQTTTFSALDSNKSGYVVSSACSNKRGLSNFTFGHPAGAPATGSIAIEGA